MDIILKDGQIGYIFGCSGSLFGRFTTYFVTIAVRRGKTDIKIKRKADFQW